MTISANALVRGLMGSAGLVMILALALVASDAQAELLHGGTRVSDTGLTGHSIASGNTSRNLAVGADGTIYAVFRGTNGIRVARSSNRGASFDSSVQLTAVDAEAEVAVSTTGIIYVAWPEGGRARVSRSLDGGQTFSASVDAGPTSTSVHIATDASRVYLIDRPGNNFLVSHDNALSFSHVALNANHVFADVHVDVDSGDVIVVVDNPTVRYYISTDYGQSFSAQLTSSPTASVYYSVGALSSGSQGRFLFVAGGQLNDALRIDLDSNAGTILPFGNNTAFQGRSLSADRCGNVVDGYVNNSTVQFQTSNDLGVSFGSPVSVAEAAYANVFINQTNGDILFLYEQSGEIFLSVYVEELPCYNPELSLSSMAFPARLVGTTSSAQQVLISNSGETSVQITGIETTGDFSHASECVGPLAAGTSCAISVTFTPSAAGTRNGQVLVSTNVFIEPRVVTLSGEGVAAAAVADFSPASLAFGSQAIGSTSASRTVVLTNSGNEQLTLDGFSIATGFAYSHDCPAELAPSQSCELAVTFSPAQELSYAGNLVLSSNAPGAPAAVALSGSGSALPAEFTLSASVASGEGDISPVNLEVVEGDTAVFTLTAAAGFRLAGVSGCAGSLVGNEYTTGPVTGACAVTASFLRADAGSGTQLDPFVLTTPVQIESLAAAPDAHFLIDGTIDVSGLGPRAPIGTDAEPFRGSLRATPGSLIEGLQGAPLFGVLGSGARIEDLGFSNPQIQANAGEPVGALVAVIQGEAGTPVVVTDIIIDGGLISGGDLAGGLAGQISHAEVTNVHASANVQGGSSVGGIAGALNDSLLHDALVTGVITGEGDDVGGLAGHVSGGEILRGVAAATVYGAGIGSGGAVGTLAAGSMLAETYATATVHGASEVGGLVGRVHASSVRDSYAIAATMASGHTAGGLAGALVDASLDRVYALGQVIAGDHAGGVVGSALTSSVQQGHWDPASTGQAGSAAGTALTTAEFRDSSLLPDWLVDGRPWRRADDVNGGFPSLLSATLFTVALDAAADGVIQRWFGGYPLGTPARLELAPAADYEFLSTTGCGGTLQAGLYVTAAVFADCTVSVDVQRVSPFLEVPETAEIGSGESFLFEADAELVAGDFSVTRDGIAVEGAIECGAEGCRFVPPSSGLYTIVISDPDSGWTHEITLTVLPPPEYTVSASVTSGEGDISPSNLQVVDGETAVFTLVAAAGYTVIGVSGCEGSLDGNQYTTGPITGACAVTASFLRADGGSGTALDPFMLMTPEQLGSLADAPDAHFLIDGAIDVSSLEPRAPIGTDAEPFRGSLRGTPGSLIEGLEGAPLFGVLGAGARVEDLGFSNPQVQANAGEPVGVLAAVIQGEVGTPVVVSDIVIDGGLISGGDFAGGLAGQVSHAEIDDVSSSASVQGGSSVGGIVGSATDTSLSDLRFDGALSATGARVGGLAGELADSLLHDALVTGVISGDGDDVGGLVGRVSGGEMLRGVAAATVYGGGIGSGGAVGTLAAGALLAETYATATVHGAEEVGGLVGRVNASGVRDSYAIGAALASGHTAGGLAGAIVDANLDRVYARGQVAGGDHAGGLVGSALTSTVQEGHWDPASTGQVGSAAGTALTTAELRDASVLPTWLVDGRPWGRTDDVNAGFPYLLSATLFQVNLDAATEGVIQRWFGGYPLGTPARLELAPADDYEFLSTTGCGGTLQAGLYVTSPVFADCTVSVDVGRVSPFLELPESGEIGSGEGYLFSTDAELVAGDFTVTRDGVAVEAAIECGAQACRFVPPATGRYTVAISDPDSGWTHEITISVLPQVDLAPDQWVATGDSVRVTFLLDDNAIDYPLAVPYTVAGSVSAGHDATAGTVLIESGLSANLEFNIQADAAAGTIVIVLGEPDGARRGTRTEHVVHVWADELPPMVDLAFSQVIDGVEVPTFQVVQGQGPVTLEGLLGELPVEALLFDWSGSDSRLAISGSGSEVVLGDVSMLDPGTYRVELAVTTPSGVIRSSGRLLRVLASCPDTAASDGCGIIDAAGQGLSHSDADEGHQLRVGSGDESPLRTLQGLTLRQGDVAFAASRDGAWVSQQELGAHAELGQSAHGALPAGVFAAAYSFEIAGLASPGQSIPVVVPLRGETTIPANARWYKYRNGEGWIRFVEDEVNALHSAPGTDGACPGPNSANWQTGLIRGHGCVRLTLQDGGPNDADGEDNGVIRDPSLLVGDHDLVVVGQSSGGGGAVHPWMLVLLGGWLLLAAARRSIAGLRTPQRTRAHGLAVILALGMFVAPAPSQALELDGAYIGASGLRTSGGASAGDISARLEGAGYALDAVEVDRRRGGFRVHAGYQLSPRIAVEVGYVDLGRARSRVALTGADTDAALNDVLAAMPLIGTGIDFGAAARMPVTDALALTARASILRWEAERRATLEGGTSVFEKRRGTGVALGLGAELALGQSNWSASVNLARNRVAGRDLDSLGLGLRYRF